MKKTLFNLEKRVVLVKRKKDNSSFKAVLPCGKTVTIQFHKDSISNNAKKIPKNKIQPNLKENYANSTPSINDLNSANATFTVIDSVGNDIHSNPKVIEAIKDFENCEKLHTIGKCKICYEI